MAADKERDRAGSDRPTGPSRGVDTPYSAGHTPSRGIPDEDKSILENVREQQEKDDEPRASGWHGDPGVPEGEQPEDRQHSSKK